MYYNQFPDQPEDFSRPIARRETSATSKEESVRHGVKAVMMSDIAHRAGAPAEA